MRRPWNSRRSGQSRRRRGLLDYAISGAFLLAIAALAAGFAAMSSDKVTGNAHASDGDSLRIGSRRIRLQGIDAPELAQTCPSGPREEPCGRQSRDHLRDLIAGKKVECEGWQVDRYDRLLAQCRANGIDLNRQMVLDGWAVSYGSYAGEEASAREERRGVWSVEFETPRQWRRQNAEHGDADPVASFAGTLDRAAGRLLNLVGF